MATTKILFNTSTKIKEKAKKRAAKEETTLTAVLSQALRLYAENMFDPDDFLTEEDIAAIKESEAQIARGEVYTMEEVEEHIRLDRLNRKKA